MHFKTEDTPDDYKKRLLICLFSIALIWCVLALLTQIWPSWDNMEELVLASSFEIFYPKHPPLTTWILYPLTLVFGKKPWLTVFLAYGCISISQYFIYLLLRDIQKNQQKPIDEFVPFIAVLCSSLVLYYTIGGSIYNHNTVQLFATAGAIYFYYSAFQLEQKNISTEYFIKWFFFGVFASLSLLAKYSALIQLSLLAVHYVWKKRFLNKCAVLGLLITCAVILLMTALHFIAVFKAFTLGAGPLSYMAYSIGNQHKNAIDIFDYSNFLLGCVWNIFPVLLIFWITRKNKLKDQNTSGKDKSETWWNQLALDSQIFLIGITFLPLVITLFFALLTGSHLDAKWAFTFFLTIGSLLWVFMKVKRDYKYLVRAIFTMHIACIGIFLSASLFEKYAIHRESLANFPGDKFTQILFDRWKEHREFTKGEKIHLVAGDVWSAGLLALNKKSNDQEIKILLNGDYEQSRWLKQEDKKELILVILNKPLLDTGSSASEAKLNLLNLQALLEKSAVRGHESIQWFDDKPPLEFEWGIVIPH